MNHEPLKDLVRELTALGYHPFQLKEIVHQALLSAKTKAEPDQSVQSSLITQALVDATGTPNLDSISSEQYQSVVEALSEYKAFAAKCWSVNR